MAPSSSATQPSGPTNDDTPVHVRAYDLLIVRATDFLAANDTASAQRVARLLLSSPDLPHAHQMTCHGILSNGPEIGVYHTAQAMEIQAFEPGAARLITIPHRTPRSPPTLQAPDVVSKPNTMPTPLTPIKKDDECITTPSQPTTHTPKTIKRVTFAELLDPVKENMKKPKVGKLFPELKAMFEDQ